MADLERTKYLRDVRRGMIQHFDEDELKTLAFDLSVDWEELPGEKKSTKCQSLAMHLAQRGRLADLTILLHEERPNVEWPAIPPPEQQIDDESAIIPDSVREKALQDYLDKMSKFVLRYQLVEGGFEASTIAAAKAYTTAAKSRLDPKRMAIVIRFLVEANIGMDLLDLERIELPRVVLNKTDLTGVNFRKGNLIEADLRNTKLHRANLNQASMRFSILNGSDMSQANLHGADLQDADLREVALCDARMGEGNLKRANLSGADLSRADLRHANLTNAHLENARVVSTDLGNAVLRSAHLSESNLSGAVLVYADLSQADMRNVLLTGADLRGARLKKANLTGADLGWADLMETELDNSIIVNCRYNSSTKWPEGFNPVAAGAIMEESAAEDAT